tara:strand:+ start:1839 stop:2009 length:171 start_codon:yes stop_codon:yes gene_type:complete
MLFTPGQGLATIFIGLAILAKEFVWARKISLRIKKNLKKKRKDFISHFKRTKDESI